MVIRRAFVIGLIAVVVLAGGAAAHDLFLRLDSFFLAPNSKATVRLLNGTFDESENVIDRNRMIDVSVVGPEEQVAHPATSQWHDINNSSVLEIETGPPGTYTIGVSTKPKMIELDAESFNNYLVHDGVDDVLRARERDGELENNARERYSKHVKALVQVGEQRTSGFDAELDYPIEIVPRQNPYELNVGDTLDVAVLMKGKPVAGQLVYASYEGFHGHDENGAHIEAVKTRTDTEGIASIPLSGGGQWYVRLIHMAKVKEPNVDYESNWATLTFQMPQSTEPNPSSSMLSVFLLGAVAAVVLLYAVRRK